MASFAVPGIGGSGLDIPDMLSQLRTAENTKLNPYLMKQSSFNGQVSSWGKISSSLDTIKSNLEKLKNEGFNGVSVGDNKTFKATAGEGAIPNSYSIVVKQLAKSHMIGTAPQRTNDGRLGDTTPNNSRTVNIKVGDGKEMNVVLEDDQTSLKQIADKINGQSGDVSAEVTAAGSGQFKLVLTSKKTGSDGEIKVSVTGDPKLADVLNYDKSDPGSKMSEIVPPTDAIIMLHGEEVTRSSNTITDAITGITLELREESEITGYESDGVTPIYKSETLAVTADTSKVKSLIEEFVKNYNAFLNLSASSSAYSPPNNKGDDLAVPNPSNGALFGDGTLRRLTSQMKSTTVGNYSEASEMYQSLASLGITVKFEDVNPGEERTGTLGLLSIDSKKLDAALKDNPKEVEAMFLGKDGAEGLKGRMEGLFDTYLGDSDSMPKTEGAITTAIKGLKEQEKRIAKQITRMEQRIEDSLKRSEKEFLRLDKAMSEMNNMSQGLQSALLGLMG